LQASALCLFEAVALGLAKADVVVTKLFKSLFFRTPKRGLLGIR
jgi:hypothetical protein